MMILSIIATVVLLSVLFYHRVSLFLSSLILLAWTAALGVAGLWSVWLLVPLAIILVPFNFTPMRKSMISAPVFRGFRKVMPPMSRTEKEAIDAGTTWWEGDLFQGKPPERIIFQSGDGKHRLHAFPGRSRHFHDLTQQIIG